MKHKRPLFTALAATASAALIVTLPVSFSAAADPLGTHTHTLQVNGDENARLVENAPTFSWQLASDQRGVIQSAYRIVVTAENGEQLWDSGKVASNLSYGIRYGGGALSPDTAYTWQLTAWDGTDAELGSTEGTFRTGLMSVDGQTGWDGAQWITSPHAEPAYEHDRILSLAYTVGTDFKIGKKSAGFTFAGADDDYLLLEVAEIDGTYRLQLKEGDARGTSPFTRENADAEDPSAPMGYQPVSVDVALDGFDPAATHRIEITVDATESEDPIDQRFTIALDGAVVSTFSVPGYAATIRAGALGFHNPEGSSASYTNIRMDKATPAPVPGLLDESTEFLKAQPEVSVFAGVDGIDFKDGWLHVTDRIVQEAGDGRGEPVFRSDFGLADKEIVDASLYAAARGIYEFEINGERVGDVELAPGYTNFDQSILYQSYDVTSLVSGGANAIGVELGDGWYSGSNASLRKPYGDQPSIMGVLKVQYADGTSESITTGSGWSYSPDSPIRDSNIMDGENYDASFAATFAGWSTPGHSAGTWEPTGIADAPSAKVIGNDQAEAKIVDRISPVSRTVDVNGNVIFDFGTNLVGNVEIDLAGPAGSTAELQYGEMLNDESLGADGPAGTVYNANFRSAKVTDYYTFADEGRTTFQPKLTFHGFRYLEVSGFDGFDPANVQSGDVEALVISSVDQVTMDFESSEAGLNQLHENTVRGMLGNFLSVPTDTPARDERTGWMGDAQVFASTAVLAGDVRNFFEKWTTVDVIGTQRGGVYSSVAPQPSWQVNPPSSNPSSTNAWTDAGVIVPHAVWEAYGDLDIVEKNYVAMVEYTDKLIELPRRGFSDHLAPVSTDSALSLGAYRVHVIDLMAEMSAAVGNAADTERFTAAAAQARAEFQSTFFADGTGILSQENWATQTGYALTLQFELYPEGKQQVLSDELSKLIKDEDGNSRLTTGFIGTPNILPALSGSGNTGAAYDLILSRANPTWLYTVDQGATTYWERWNSYSKESGFGPATMNSFNHYAYGAVSEWIYENVGGLQAEGAGFGNAVLKPNLDPSGRISWANAELQTTFGALSSEWKIDGDDVTYAVEVPANSTATVHVPLLAEGKHVYEGAGAAENAPGVTLVGVENGAAVYTVQSGSYVFSTSSEQPPVDPEPTGTPQPTSTDGTGTGGTTAPTPGTGGGSGDGSGNGGSNAGGKDGDLATTGIDGSIAGFLALLGALLAGTGAAFLIKKRRGRVTNE